ncbi:chalcone isomerase family protein [uncultured Shewanella sp.]|uniref:chalcone isomerase family protein n=1 Tax=uncultured Shewanella sp. TaxID=173975 RepID=UPI00261F1128|nr:chalcone isomerase family protein [uncultured Shewanella sp.]
MEPDDELTFFIDKNGTSRFYKGKTLLGVINDIQFGQAFMGIWLSKNTSEPKLRQALLGDKT